MLVVMLQDIPVGFVIFRPGFGSPLGKSQTVAPAVTLHRDLLVIHLHIEHGTAQAQQAAQVIAAAGRPAGPGNLQNRQSLLFLYNKTLCRRQRNCRKYHRDQCLPAPGRQD